MNSISVEKVGRLEGHNQPVYSIIAAQKPYLLYTGSGDNMVVQWDLRSLEHTKVLAKVPGTVYALHYLPERQLLFIGHRGGNIHIVDVEQKKEIKFLQYHSEPIFNITTSLQHNFFVAAAGDGSVSVWSLHDFSLITPIQLSEENIRHITLDAEETEMAIACSDTTIRIIDTASFEQKAVLKSHERSVFCARYSPCGRYLITGSMDARFNVWDRSKNYELMYRVPAHYFTINSIVFSPDQQYFATGSRDRTIKVWRLRDFELLKVINYEKHGGHRFSVNHLHWSAYSDYLISGSDDNTLMVWKLHFHND